MEIQEQNQNKNVNQPVSEIETTAPGKLRVIKRNGKGMVEAEGLFQS